MDYTVKVVSKNGTVEHKVVEGTNILAFLRKSSFDISSPCGGKGTCGKCRVKLEGFKEKPSEKEAKLLGSKDLENGYRLACYNKINSDMTLYFDKEISDAHIMTEGKKTNVKIKPLMTKELVQLDTPSIHDQGSDVERLARVMKKSKSKFSLAMLKTLPDSLREKDYKVTFVYLKNKLVGIEPGDTKDSFYGIAIDIGTTTLAAYLYNLKDGSKVGVYSQLNPQKKFGADVISRIEYTMESQNALEEMQSTIVKCINDIVKHFSTTYGIRPEDIYTAVFVGNTTMMHFLMGIPAKNIAVAPFIPVTTEMHLFQAADMGIKINPAGYSVVFPSVSGYIGADTVAAVLSSEMHNGKKISLLIDIGTNGEIVLGNSEWLYSCSTAAGPAFEGANIRNGVGGISGAIDKVSFTPEFSYTTINSEKPVGICGSGVVDIIAGLLEVGIIDETGRILDQDEVEGSVNLKERIIEIDNKNAFLISDMEQNNLAITQKDVRELQNAKAAIAAGIKVLVKQAGISMEQVDRVYLAGGFGSYINIDSALKISLIPNELKGRITSIGNAAGSGAVEGLLSKDMLEEALKIKSRIKYVELSALHDFMDEYVECMMFE